MSRWVDPAPEGSPLILVLKDLNFQGKTIYLGEPWGTHCLVFSIQGEVRRVSLVLPSAQVIKNPDSGVRQSRIQIPVPQFTS